MGEISRDCCPDPDWKLRLGLEEYLGASGSGWSCDLNCQDKKVEDFFSSIYPNFLYRNLRKLAPNIRKSRGQSWISPTLGSKIGKSWDCPQLFRTFLENSKSRDGLSRSIPTLRRIWDWPSRPIPTWFLSGFYPPRDILPKPATHYHPYVHPTKQGHSLYLPCIVVKFQKWLPNPSQVFLLLRSWWTLRAYFVLNWNLNCKK